MRDKRWMVLCVALCVTGNAVGARGADFSGTPLGIRGDQLVDDQGRTVLLHGMNARIRGVFDDVRDDGTHIYGDIPVFTQQDADVIRAEGFNALRLAVNWSALEPTEDGGLDEGVLKQMEEVVGYCEKAGLWVLIDWHQDGYAKYIGDDGAPLWATLPPPLPRAENDPLRNASKAAQDAFATLYGEGEHGPRIKARFAQMIAAVAKRFAGHPAVIGFEILNEPLGPVDAMNAFHREMAQVLIQAAPGKLVFFESHATRNVQDTAPLGDGAIGPGTVYAPHMYTGIFTPLVRQATVRKSHLARSFKRAVREAESFDAPLVITEWGYDPWAPRYAEVVNLWQDQQNAALAGAFYWVWKEYGHAWGFYDMAADGTATPRPEVLLAMARPRLEAAAGRLTSVVYDAEARRLTVGFEGNGETSPVNRFTVGRTPGFAQPAATCDGKPAPVEGQGVLRVRCGGSGAHTVVLAGQP